MAFIVERVAARIGGIPVLHDVSVTLAPGRTLALLGKNGMGKTTTLKTLAGLAEMTHGRFLIDDVPVGPREPPWVRRRRGLVYIPEDAGVFQTLTVGENLRLGTVGDPRRALDLFPGLEALWQRRAALLSGGERKMLALARAWLSDGRWFLIDEPSLGLAPAVVASLAPAIRRLTDKGGVVLVEQNLALAEAIADDYALMSQGRVIDTGPMTALRNSPAFLASLLVDAATFSPREEVHGVQPPS
jgi:branched-chain amino acid transport system ATP-binding protein